MNACDGKFRALIDGHFAGGLSRVREESLRRHLPSCPICRSLYQEYLAAEALDPKGRGARARLARALGLAGVGQSPERVRSRRWRLGALALAGASCLVLLVTRTSMFSSDFTARGPKAEGRALKAEVAVYRVRGGRESERVTDRISVQDELAFAYRNETGKAFLMIFAVDSTGRVAWYHPAWTDPASNPRAIPISKQIGFKELPEAVRQPLPAGRLVVHALFLDGPTDVRSIEDRLSRVDPLGDLPFLESGEIDHKLLLTVTP